MTDYVFDTEPLIAYFYDEPADDVSDRLEAGENEEVTRSSTICRSTSVSIGFVRTQRGDDGRQFPWPVRCDVDRGGPVAADPDPVPGPAADELLRPDVPEVHLQIPPGSLYSTELTTSNGMVTPEDCQRRLPSRSIAIPWSVTLVWTQSRPRDPPDLTAITPHPPATMIPTKRTTNKRKGGPCRRH